MIREVRRSPIETGLAFGFLLVMTWLPLAKLHADDSKLIFRDQPSDTPKPPRYSLTPDGADGPRLEGASAAPQSSEDGAANPGGPEGTSAPPPTTPDPAATFFHQGSFTHQDEHGNLLAQGEYQSGKRQGPWVRWFSAPQGEILGAPVSKGFTPPFISRANFIDGKVEGTWTLTDSRDQKIGQWEIKHGRPNGTCTWWHPNGQKMREVQYIDGIVDGSFQEWTEDGRQLASDTYHAGRRIQTKVSWYSPGHKKAEGTFLQAGQINRCICDWWSASVTTEEVAKYENEDQHGLWTWWYPDGQLKMQGSFLDGNNHGKFAWWYPNSQKQAEGEFDHGKETGRWTWYHPNGMKSSTGFYLAGEHIGRWSTYRADGRLDQIEQYRVPPGWKDPEEKAESEVANSKDEDSAAESTANKAKEPPVQR